MTPPRVLLVFLFVTHSIIASGFIAGANAQDIDGSWQVRWAQAVRTHADGSMEIQRWGDAELVLSSDGDSVFGYWKTNIQEPVQWELSGQLENGGFRLVGTEHDSTNPELDVVERIEIRGSVEGGTISGTVELRFEGRTRPPSPRPFRGSRAP